MAENGKQNTNISPAQRRLIAALLSERDVRSAARVARVSERTAYRWMDDPTFRAELTRQESGVVDQVTRGLLTMQADALEKLHQLIAGTGVIAAGIRLQAVKTALEIQLKYRELNSLEARIAALEAAQNADSNKTT